MEVASHNALMDPILPELATALADLRPAPPRIPFISTVQDTTAPAAGCELLGGQCAPTGAVQPGHHHRGGQPCHVRGDQPASDADPRDQRNPRRGGPSPQRGHPVARGGRHGQLPHQPQHHPHRPAADRPRTHPNPTQHCPPPPGTTPATGSTPHRPRSRTASTRYWASGSPIRPLAGGCGKTAFVRICCGSAITSSTGYAFCPVRHTPKWHWRRRPRHWVLTTMSRGWSVSCLWSKSCR